MMTTKELLVHEERMRVFLAEAEMTRMARLVADSASAPSGLRSLSQEPCEGSTTFARLLIILSICGSATLSRRRSTPYQARERAK